MNKNRLMCWNRKSESLKPARGHKSTSSSQGPERGNYGGGYANPVGKVCLELTPETRDGLLCSTIS